MVAYRPTGRERPKLADLRLSSFRHPPDRNGHRAERCATADVGANAAIALTAFGSVLLGDRACAVNSLGSKLVDNPQDRPRVEYHRDVPSALDALSREHNRRAEGADCLELPEVGQAARERSPDAL